MDSLHLIKSSKRLGKAVTAQTLSGFPARSLKVIGVTGTDGKTTTCLLIAKMLEHSGKKVAVVTTALVDYGGGRGPQANLSHRTTPGAFDMVKHLKQARRSGAEYLVIEVSSHGLDQYRVWGVPFYLGVFTNLSHEHLDYHRTMDKYARAKLKLFKLVSNNKKGLRVGVINADSPFASKFIDSVKHPITYGINRGDIKAVDIKSSMSGSSYKARTPDGELDIKLKLPGRFNVYNSLAAVGVGRAIGLTPQEIQAGIESFLGVPGRMEEVKTSKRFRVFVDYAVTPNALTSAIAAARELTDKGRVLLVFGATGDRDKSKRASMGQAATTADLIYLTDDETYKENPPAIRQAVFKGIEAAKAETKCKEIGDRRQAIAAALQDARAGDVVLVTGLGHQMTRNMGGNDQPWNDAQVIKSLLK